MDTIQTLNKTNKFNEDVFVVTVTEVNRSPRTVDLILNNKINF
jgi:hypothetical protein